MLGKETPSKLTTSNKDAQSELIQYNTIFDFFIDIATTILS